MVTTTEINQIAKKFQTAKSYAELFGPLVGDNAAKKNGLKTEYRRLARHVHPDVLIKLSDAARKKGEDLFKQLAAARTKAEEAIDAGTYDKPQSIAIEPTVKPIIELRSSLGTYRLHNDSFRQGDFSVLYRGDHNGANIIAKIAIDPTDNTWLEQEAKVLTRFKTSKGKLKGVAPFVPLLLDTFLIPDGRKRFRVNVLGASSPNMVSITDLIGHFPGGLDPRDAAWIFRRALGQVAAASMLDMVHCAITPDHVLVDIETHDPIHIGWAHALPIGKKITHIIDRWKDLYPKEVFSKGKIDARTDVYMAGMTMFKLLGKVAIPPEINKVLSKCVDKTPSKRYQGGNEALDDFTTVVRKLWGRGYRKLVIPT